MFDEPTIAATCVLHLGMASDLAALMYSHRLHLRLPANAEYLIHVLATRVHHVVMLVGTDGVFASSSTHTAIVINAQVARGIHGISLAAPTIFFLNAGMRALFDSWPEYFLRGLAGARDLSDIHEALTGIYVCSTNGFRVPPLVHVLSPTEFVMPLVKTDRLQVHVSTPWGRQWARQLDADVTLLLNSFLYQGRTRNAAGAQSNTLMKSIKFLNHGDTTFVLSLRSVLDQPQPGYYTANISLTSLSPVFPNQPSIAYPVLIQHDTVVGQTATVTLANSAIAFELAFPEALRHPLEFKPMEEWRVSFGVRLKPEAVYLDAGVAPFRQVSLQLKHLYVTWVNVRG